MSLPPTNYSVMEAGGFESKPTETMMDHYAWPLQAPDVEDAIVLNRSVDPAVRPRDCYQRFLPKGRIFSLTANDRMVPGVMDEHEIPIACILIGSNAHDGDVTGGPRIGDPQNFMDAQVPIKDEANAGFWHLSAGYIYETSEFDSSTVAQLVPGQPVTAIHHMTNFDIAGLLTPGEVYVDHIVGTVVRRPTTCGSNKSIQTVCIVGKVVPRLRKNKIAKLRE
jgi:hypothetical protein